MSSVPGHPEVLEKLPAAALTILEPTEMDQVQAHIRACSECATLLEEYREAATILSLSIPPTHMDPARSDALRKRLLVRARTRSRNTLKASTMIYRWSGWMVAAGLAGILLMHHSVHRPLDYGWLAAGVLLIALLGLGIYAWVQRRRVAELNDRLTGTD